jgi:hypothetical protein
MKIKKELIRRQVGEDTILVPVGQTVYTSNGLFILNEVGAFIWDLLPEAETAEQLIRAVLDAYDIDEASAGADVEEFLESLRKLGIL